MFEDYVIEHVLEFYTRWHGVILQTVSKDWHRVAKKTRFCRMIVATISRSNALVFFTENLSQRVITLGQNIPEVVDYTRYCSVGEFDNYVSFGIPSLSEFDNRSFSGRNGKNQGPTGILALPKQLWIAYKIPDGIFIYNVIESIKQTGCLQFNRFNSYVTSPECMVRAKNFVFVSSATGYIYTLDMKTGSTLFSYTGSNFSFWNMTFYKDCLYVCTHTSGVSQFSFLPSQDRGSILSFKVNFSTGDLSKCTYYLGGLSTPSGLQFYNDKLYLTAFSKKADSSNCTEHRYVLEWLPDLIPVIFKRGIFSAKYWSQEFCKSVEPWDLVIVGDALYLIGHKNLIYKIVLPTLCVEQVYNFSAFKNIISTNASTFINAI